MKLARFTAASATAVAALAFAACGDPVSTDGLIDDSAVTLDVAASAADAVGFMLENMALNEAFAGGGPDGSGAAATFPSSVIVSRARTCYDAAGAAVANCLPFSAVRMIAIAASIEGTRSSTRTNDAGQTVSWTGAVHRSTNDTIRRVFTNTTETSRVHTGVTVGNDTTTFTDGTFTRKIAEAVRDSVRSLTFNLPRSSNPYPVSGSIVRNSTMTVEVSSGDRKGNRGGTHRVEVIFPADAQGNVVLKINGKTCQLNLVTRRVSNCS